MIRLTETGIERLEDRIALAVFVWDGSGGNGNWFTASNWTPDGVPGAGDTAVLDIASTINVTSGVTIAVLQQSNGTITAPSEVTLTVTGSLQWMGGVQRGALTTFLAEGSSSTIATAALLDGLTLNNAGTIALTGSGALDIRGARINNLVTGVFDIKEDGDFFIPQGFGFGTGVFSNAGTLRKSGTGGVSELPGVGSVPITFTNNGTVDVQTGILRLNDPSATTSGIFQTAAGANIEVRASLAVAAGSQFTGAGKTKLVVGVTTATGAILSGALSLDGATLTGTHTLLQGLTWTAGGMSGGTTTIPSGTTVNAAAFNLTNHTFINQGTVAFTGVDPLFMAGSTIENTAGALFDFQTDADIFMAPGFGFGVGTFNNAGTLRKSVGTGDTQLPPGSSVPVNVNNTGLVEVLTGTISFYSGVSNSGIFKAEATANIEIRTNFTVGDGAQFIGAGKTRLIGGTTTANGAIASGSLVLEGARLTGTHILNGGLTWISGEMSGGSTTIPALSSIAATALNLSNHTLINRGSILYTGDGSIFMAGSTLNNDVGALFDLRTDADFFMAQGFGFGVGTFNNAGIFRKSAGTGLSELPVASSVPINFNNTGTVDVQTGTLAYVFNVTNAATFNAASGASIEIRGGSFVVPTGAQFTGAGTTRLIGGTTTANGEIASKSLVLDGARLTGTHVLNGGLTWMSGEMAGGSTTIPALSSIAATSLNLNNHTLVNRGVVAFTGTGPIFMAGSTFSNELGATFDLRSDANFFMAPGFGFGVGTFNNAGLFRKSVGTGLSELPPASSVPITFNNSGVVDVQTGTLRFPFAVANANTFNAAAGANIEILGSFTVSAGAEFTGAGKTRLLAGTTTASGNIVSGSLVLQGATLTGTHTLLQGLTWTAGGMSGGTTTIPSGTTVNAAAFNLTNHTFINQGTVAFTGADPLFMAGSTIENTAGALFDFQTDADIFMAPGFGFGVGTFNNAGTLRKSVGTGDTQLPPGSSVPVNVNNTGLVEVLTGTISFYSGVSNSGIFKAEATANIEIRTNFTVGDGAQFIGAGKTRLIGGTTTANGGIASGSLILEGARLTGSHVLNGGLTWTSGEMNGGSTTIPALSSIAATALNLSNHTLINRGSILYTGDGSIFMAGSTLNNDVGALFDLRTDADFFIAQGFGFGVGTFNNAGIFRKSAGTGLSELPVASSVPINFNNTGTVDVQTGTLAYVFNVTNAATFNAASGATIEIRGGSFVVPTGAQFTGAGTTRLIGGTTTANGEIASGSLVLAGATFTGTQTLAEGLTWLGGTMAGGATTIPSGAVVNAAAFNLNNHTFINEGTVAITATGDLFIAGSTIENAGGGLIDIQSDADFFMAPGFGFGQGTINNSGTFRKSSATGETAFGLNGVVVNFTNTGTLEATSGTLRFAHSFTQAGGLTSLSGGSIQTNSVLNFSGGELIGSGTILGSVSNTGANFRPGGTAAAGTLTISSDYTQAVAGSLSLELGGQTAGTQYDVLNIGGTATLDGTLTISLIDNFPPFIGRNFDVLVAANRVGTFDTENVPSVLSSYTAAGLRLVGQLPLPAFSVSDAEVREGHSGTSIASFRVTLSAGSDEVITVQFQTVAGTAAQTGDFSGLAPATLTFAPFELTKTIEVTVLGDLEIEDVETFFLELSTPTNATIADAEGVGSVLDDDTEIVIKPKDSTITYVDEDGDVITIATSKGALAAENLFFSPTGNLELIDLNGDVRFAGANITISARTVGGSNGLIDVSAIDATNLDLGKISISGNLGKVVVGDGDPSRPALKSLIVGSLGSDEPGALLLSEINGSLAKLIVKGNVRGAAVDVLGTLGSTTIGGDITGDLDSGALLQRSVLDRGIVDPRVSGGLPAGAFNAESMARFTVKGAVTGGSVTSAGNINAVSVGKDLTSGGIAAGGQIKNVRVLGELSGVDADRPSVIAALAKVDATTPGGAVALNALLVKGDVENAQVLLGYRKDVSDAGVRYLPRNPDAGAGTVVVKGDWIASNLVAGVFDATGDGFGQNDTAIGGDTTATIVSRIASVVIKGAAMGTSAAGDSYAITAQEIGKLTIDGQKVELNNAQKDNVLLDSVNGDFRLVEI